MGKRKRRTDQNKTPPPSDFMPYSSRMDSLSKEKSSHSVGTSAIRPLSSIMDIMDTSVKLPNQSATHHHSRTILLRHPHHYYGRQYSRRSSAHRADASSSHGKGTLHDDKLSFKLARQGNSESGWHTDEIEEESANVLCEASITIETESWEKASRRPERIRSVSSTMDAISADVMKMICGICRKQLKRRSYILGNTISSNDLSVVAVLVCGHVYHADCLEAKTCHEDRRDPPCPMCVSSLLSEVAASSVQD